MSKVIKIIGWANGEDCPHAGEYVEKFDHDAYDGIGYGEFTPNIGDALRFDNAGTALDFWRKQSTVNPIRPDGKPNRPLTAATVQIEDA